ncbi:ribosomal RNA small subunit methyltransferase A [candidate division WOR-3 bacterium]|nr:ribosomal RNA small subunit methyltransferase A [candidate division WOR-3 bacterium]
MRVKEIQKILGEKYLTKSRGQNLLLEENVARSIADLVEVFEDKRVLEIGSGLGIITKYLVKNGFDVTAVEIDKDFCQYLKTTGVNVINEDFLSFPIDETLPEVVVGALPFSISIRILLRIKDHRDKLKRWFVVVQKEVAERLISEPGRKSYSSLSILFQILFEMNIEFDISPNSFFPKPEVTSTVLKGILRHNPIIEVTEEFERFLRDIFRYRRKTLKNNLYDYNTEGVNFALRRRAETLSKEEVVELYRELMK